MKLENTICIIRFSICFLFFYCTLLIHSLIFFSFKIIYSLLFLMAQPFEIFSPSLIRLYDKKKYTFPCNSNSLHLFISISLSLSLIIVFDQVQTKRLAFIYSLSLSLIIVCANNSRRGFNCCWLVFPIFMKGALIFPSLYFMFAN